MLWLQGRCHAQADTLALGCVERAGDKKCTLVDCWSFGLMKACPLYWYLYFAFHLASPSFLVLLPQATAAAALLWHMASSILRWALSLWLDGWSEWASKHFLFFCSSPAYMHSSQVTPRILHYGDACGVSILFSHPAIRLQKHFHSGLHLISTFRIL